MSYAIAAAGTGGHVFPGLAVGEALVARGVPKEDVVYLGGSRLEASVYPEAGFPFLQVELRGLKRSLSWSNLGIPLVVGRAVVEMGEAMRERGVRAVLGLGGYVTIPAAFAARRHGIALAVSEQNAEAGLANAIAGRMAARRFGAFPETRRLPGAEWVGNPVRRSLATFDRTRLAPEAFERYALDPETPVLGVFGGSLGAGVINRAITDLAIGWRGDPIQILHLAGTAHAEELQRTAGNAELRWKVLSFEDRMDLFYAACDLIVARAGGAVAELAVTATPSILIPGSFGSGSHQVENAAVFAGRGASTVIAEENLEGLGDLVSTLISDGNRLAEMAGSAVTLARPDAADVIASVLEELHG